MQRSGERFGSELYRMPPPYRKNWGTKSGNLQNDKTLKRLPFTNCGVDKFCPFLIKEGEKELWKTFYSLSN